MESLSEFSYLVHFPAFRTHYSAFIFLAQLAASIVVLAGMASTSLRERLTFRVLGLFWLLTGLNYYAMTVGGWYGSLLFALCLFESFLMLFNIEQLRFAGRISFTTEYLPLIVDLRTVNTAVGCLGAFTMMVTSM